MIIHKKLIRDIDLTSLQHLVTRVEHRQLLVNKPGIDHYALLAHISLMNNGLRVIELGTHHGTSSLALSINEKTQIITYDIKDRYSILRQPHNVKRRIGNIFDRNEQHELLDSDLIFLDTAHDGIFEAQVYDFLCKNNFTGVLLLDDIHLNDEMRIFWENIEQTKYDITSIGHGKCHDGVAGTGIVDFGHDLTIFE